MFLFAISKVFFEDSTPSVSHPISLKCFKKVQASYTRKYKGVKKVIKKLEKKGLGSLTASEKKLVNKYDRALQKEVKKKCNY